MINDVVSVPTFVLHVTFLICSHQAADSSCGPAVGCGGRSPCTGVR